MTPSALAIGGSHSRLSAGGCWSERLLGERLPDTGFTSTGGGTIDLADAPWERLIVFVFPGIDRGVGSARDPDGLLGSGCSVQSRGFRDLVPDFQALGTGIVGLSADPLGEQLPFAERERLPFPLLCDPDLILHECVGLPVQGTTSGTRVYERLSFLAHAGVIQRVFHPVPIPRRNAADVLTHIDPRQTHHY